MSCGWADIMKRSVHILLVVGGTILGVVLFLPRTAIVGSMVVLVAIFSLICGRVCAAGTSILAKAASPDLDMPTSRNNGDRLMLGNMVNTSLRQSSSVASAILYGTSDRKGKHPLVEETQDPDDINESLHHSLGQNADLRIPPGGVSEDRYCTPASSTKVCLSPGASTSYTTAEQHHRENEATVAKEDTSRRLLSSYETLESSVVDISPATCNLEQLLGNDLSGQRQFVGLHRVL